MTDVLGAVVRLEPPWEALPSDVPAPVRTLLRQCLVKDRRATRRRHRGGTLRARSPGRCRSDRAGGVAIEPHRMAGRCAGNHRDDRHSGRRTANVPLGHARARPRPVHHRAAREDGSLAGPPLEARAALHNLLSRLMAATSCSWPVPNPRSKSGCDRWPARRRGRFREPRAAAFPFWSPDSQFIAFFAGGKLKKVAIAGGPPIVLADAAAGRRRELESRQRDRVRIGAVRACFACRAPAACRQPSRRSPTERTLIGGRTFSLTGGISSTPP